MEAVCQFLTQKLLNLCDGCNAYKKSKALEALKLHNMVGLDKLQKSKKTDVTHTQSCGDFYKTEPRSPTMFFFVTKRRTPNSLCKGMGVPSWSMFQNLPN